MTKIFDYSPATREGIAKPCIFSDAGWARFSESMALRRFAHTADELQAQGSAVLSESPAILTRGIDSDGAYVWITEVRVTPWLATETTRIPAMSRTARIVITQAKDDRGDTVLRVKDPR